MPLIFISTPTKRKGLGTEKALSYNKGPKLDPVTMLWDQVSGVHLPGVKIIIMKDILTSGAKNGIQPQNPKL